MILPIPNKIDISPMSENIVGIRPNETWESAINRFMIEKRIQKIKNIKDSIKKGK